MPGQASAVSSGGEDARLTERIREIHELFRGVYGSPRIHAELAGRRRAARRKRVERLMRQAGISGLVARKRGRTTSASPGSASARTSSTAPSGRRPGPAVGRRHHLSQNLGGLAVPGRRPGRLLRRIVGWSMAGHMRAELVTDALAMALAHRRPEPGLIRHSDQGSQFVSLAFGQQARDAGIAQSMGSRGDCFDNAVAESFFATLKKELIHRRSWPTKPSSHRGLRLHRSRSTTASAGTAASASSRPRSSRRSPTTII